MRSELCCSPENEHGLSKQIQFGQKLDFGSERLAVSWLLKWRA